MNSNTNHTLATAHRIKKRHETTLARKTVNGKRLVKPVDFVHQRFI